MIKFIEVPQNYINLLENHSIYQDELFLQGFVSCLSYQYPLSKLASFNSSSLHGCFKDELLVCLDSGTFAPSSLEPVNEGGGIQ